MLTDLLHGEAMNGLVKSRYGWMLYNKNDIYIGASMAKYGEFSHGEMVLFLQLVKPGSYIVEVGANIGAHTLGLSKHIGNGKIYAYEPQRIVFQLLCANIALNSCTNVYCFEQAVSNRQEKINLPAFDYGKRGNYGGISIDKFDKGDAVDVVILDQQLENIERFDLLKVDVEGMEYQVIHGAQSIIAKHKPVLYVENDRVEKSKDLIELIQAMGYRLYWHTPPLYNRENYAGDEENIFARIASWNMLCFHQSISVNLSGFTEITDSHAHPLRKLHQ